MTRLRILLLAPEANPESISLALEGYCHGAALAERHAVTVVVQSRNVDVIRRSGAPFAGIEGIKMRWLDGICSWSMRCLFRGNFHHRALTPFLYPFALAFEWYAWRRLRSRIKAGEFDVVMRLLPTNPIYSSPFAYFLRNSRVPFVIGPINGGLPWPVGFSQSSNQRSWIDNLRRAYRVLPFARSTYRRAAAIIAGSSQTYTEFSAYRSKLFYIPENGVSDSLCSDEARRTEDDRKLELIFVGALVPYKACDLALRAAAPFLRDNLAHFTVVGDGPERGRLEQLANFLGIRSAVSFCGMLPHGEAMQRLRTADVMVYPSVREFGGAVVVEALAVGAVPLVADFGGPGDTVRSDVGFKVPLTSESAVVLQMEQFLGQLLRDRSLLHLLRERGISYVREKLTWKAKAEDVSRVLHWVVRSGSRPDLPPPKILSAT